jgi:dinuclear metal center YbgI/SA1388 family protein
VEEGARIGLSTPLVEIVDYLDAYLRIAEIPDYPNALNGLQVQGARPVERVALAVDAAQATIDGAIEQGADLLLVHHGMFWDGNQPVVGRRYSRLRSAISSGLAVYAAHVPLDVHPEVGNNAVLATAAGIEIDGMFGEYRGHPLGAMGALEIGREALCARLDELLGGRVRMLAFGPERVRRVGVITGGAADLMHAAREAGLDAFITGEASHHHFLDAEEAGINVFLGGHYATEVWGVRALGDHLAGRFGVDVRFIDHPSGL